MDAEAMLAHELESISLGLWESMVPIDGLGIYGANLIGTKGAIGTHYRFLSKISVGTKNQTQLTIKVL